MKYSISPMVAPHRGFIKNPRCGASNRKSRSAGVFLFRHRNFTQRDFSNNLFCGLRVRVRVEVRVCLRVRVSVTVRVRVSNVLVSG